MPRIYIKPENYYLGIWYCEWTEGNLLACAWRNLDGIYEGSFRYKENYVSNETGMTWYSIVIPRDSECDIADAFDSMFRLMSLKHFCDTEYTAIDSYGDKAWRVFKDAPFIKTVSDKEGIERPLKH